MAVPLSLWLPLGLSLCCALHFSSASSIRYRDNCMVFDKVFTANDSSLKVSSDVLENITVYTVWVPVNDKDSAVVLRAVDKNNRSVGLWQDADEDCNSSALYHVTRFKRTLFKANWIVSNSEDLTEVELQVFNVDLNNTATFSSLKLGGKVITTPWTSTFTTSGNNLTTTMTTTMNTTVTTTLATTRSFAIRVLSSPIAGAVHMLLVFLTSKLLF
ncbi:placenta-expressed transcript 1 protein [Sciurus carolinensis]|uniref:placenta-expressed transcript 1 protein n=1 Tax=Sciurus carolinensis TaxID=30640 RepID=UPI001FB3339B|nr:placenta-expressed transcript 1 protein [Sciurus carolinensis]